MPISCSTKICHKVVFNDNQNKGYSESTIKAPGNSVKICPKLTKTSKQNDRLCCGIPAVKFGQVPHPMQYF